MAAGFKGPLVVYALVEENTQRPPVDLARVALAFIYFRSQVGEGTRLARQRLMRREIGGDVLQALVWMRVAGWEPSVQNQPNGRVPRSLAAHYQA